MQQLLLDHGARINQKDEQGHTPLARAQEKKHKKAIAFLRKLPAPRPRQGGTACLLATEIVLAVKGEFPRSKHRRDRDFYPKENGTSARKS